MPDRPNGLFHLSMDLDYDATVHTFEEDYASMLWMTERVEFEPVGTLQEIMFGPSRVADGTMNLIGALRRAMATTGYTDVKEFQRIEVVVQD